MTVSRIALVRPEKAKSIEGLLMRMAQGGQLRGRVTEDQLIGVLDQVSLPPALAILLGLKLISFHSRWKQQKRVALEAEERGVEAPARLWSVQLHFLCENDKETDNTSTPVQSKKSTG